MKADSPANSMKISPRWRKPQARRADIRLDRRRRQRRISRSNCSRQRPGVKFIHVPYRGAAPALTDLLGGQVQVFFADVPVLMPQIIGGKVKRARRRLEPAQPDAADVPTLAEQGYPDTMSDNWYGAAGAGEDAAAPVIAKLHAAFTKPRSTIRR